ncbi:MAG: DNA methyltransferase [Hyphomicrobiales bacterium]|nr:DNA methyltransferase [Hyphomicrobiales bacterium]
MTSIDALALERLPVAALRPNPRNARTHSRKQIAQIAASIERFGFTNPVLVDEAGVIIAGHGRVAAAKALGLNAVPVLRIGHLSEAEKRAYILADNKLALNAGWDPEILAIELQFLSEVDIDFDAEITGFSTAEIDLIIGDEAAPEPPESVSPLDRGVPAVTRSGDLWLMGDHRLLCADALEATSYQAVQNGELARLVIADPPYNVPIDGHVCGKGQVRHAEFAMASGEMSAAEFTAFLAAAIARMTEHSVDGSLHYLFMDWRHMAELLAAAKGHYAERKALCVWNKTNGGMGSFYRSKHELCFVFKNGKAPHVNAIDLGRTGRYRTNVWDYAGVNVFRPGRREDLEAHPTVKPTVMIADIMKDASKRGDLVLDPFAGSGATILAAERIKRRAAAIEIDPHYVDRAIARWQAATGAEARLEATGERFAEVAAARQCANVLPTEAALQAPDAAVDTAELAANGSARRVGAAGKRRRAHVQA